MPRGLALLVLLLSGAAHADVVVFDFTAEPKPVAKEPSQDVETKLRARFPEPDAKAKVCEDGRLLSRITTARAAVTRPGLPEDIFLIDYCPIGNGTRRLVILDGDAVAYDRVLGAAVPANEVLAAVDIDGDGKAELVLTQDTMRGAGILRKAQLVRPTRAKPLVLGAWDAMLECNIDIEDAIAHTVTYRPGGKPRFKDATTKLHCFYPPAPPPPR